MAAEGAGFCAVEEGDEDRCEGLVAGALPEVAAGVRVHGGERHLARGEGGGEGVVASAEADQFEDQGLPDGGGDAGLGVEEVREGGDGAGVVAGSWWSAVGAVAGAFEVEVGDGRRVWDGAAPR